MPKAKRPESYRRRGYYPSSKNKSDVCYQSSYELRAMTLLEEDPAVVSYRSQVAFWIDGRKRFIDLLVQYTDGRTSIIEIKDARRLERGDYTSQIEDNQAHADLNSWEFKVWTEKNLGFDSEYYLLKWADDFISKLTGMDFVEIRLKANREKVGRHYRERLCSQITIDCEFCKEQHTIRKIPYEKAIREKGRYICIKENGYLIGKQSKEYLKKENPHAIEGKKKCLGPCGEIKNLTEFGKDSSRADGKADRCKVCRSSKETARYHTKKLQEANHE